MKGYERSPEMTIRLGSDLADYLIKNPQVRLGQALCVLLKDHDDRGRFSQFLWNVHDEEILRRLNERAV